MEAYNLVARMNRVKRMNGGLRKAAKGESIGEQLRKLERKILFEV